MLKLHKNEVIQVTLADVRAVIDCKLAFVEIKDLQILHSPREAAILILGLSER